MPTGFDKFNLDMQKFEQSALFKEKYDDFIDIISMPFGEVKSSLLENHLKLPGSSIRRLVRHARRKGVAVISNEKGYCIARNFAQLKPTIDQLHERALDILNTEKSLKSCFPDEQQTRIAI